MQSLAVLIAMFSVVNTAILSTYSDEPDLDNLFLPNPPSSGLLSLNPMTPANDEPSEPSLPNANLETTLDMPESLTFNPQIAQQPGAKSADEPSMIDTSTVNTIAQTSTDDSYSICSPDTSTGRKQKKRQQCVNLLHFLLLPKSPERTSPKGTRTQEEQKNKLIVQDQRYVNEKYGVVGEERAQRVQRAVLVGEKWCAVQHGIIEARTPAYQYPLCCLGPEETVSFTVPSRLFRRHDLSYMNVLNCLLFMLDRPMCVRPLAKWYCCKDIDPMMTEWGFKGIICLSLESPIFII